MRRRVLFVCGRNLRRSPTAEKLYQNDPRLQVRSAGLSPGSPRRLSPKDLQWADLVLVMERPHQRRIEPMLAELETRPILACLDIPDDYEFMDPELVELLHAAVDSVLLAPGTLPVNPEPE